MGCLWGVEFQQQSVHPWYNFAVVSLLGKNTHNFLESHCKLFHTLEPVC